MMADIAAETCHC